MKLAPNLLWLPITRRCTESKVKVLAIFMILVGAIAFWSFQSDSTDREEVRSDSVAMNYALFRNAVFNYALESKSPGTVLPNTPGLNLPAAWTSIRPWQGLIRLESDGFLFCYVFGPADPMEITAVQKLFHNSKTIGWNNAGVLARNGGDPMPLPLDIPWGSLVSLIRLD